MLRRLFRILAAGLLVAAAALQPVIAQERWRHAPPPHGYAPRPWHQHWHRGHWIHSRHLGRLGWWWVIGGAWYFYPAPIYPYPEPPLVVVTPPPPALIPPQYYYYCPYPPGYYPGLPACPMGWQLVPAAPMAPPVAPMPIPAVPPPGPSGSLDKSTAGAALGAVGGAVAGAQIGQGPGQLAATVAGTLLGALIGHEIGASLDRTDLLAAGKAERVAVAAPLGQAIAWNNPDSGHSGTITPLRDGKDASGHYCRAFQQTIVIAGRSQQTFGTACRQADGSWQLVKD